MSNFPSTDIMLMMCSISGLGSDVEEVLPTLTKVTELLFSKWSGLGPDTVLDILASGII